MQNAIVSTMIQNSRGKNLEQDLDVYTQYPFVFTMVQNSRGKSLEHNLGAYL